MASWSNSCPEVPSRQQNSKRKGEGRLELPELQGEKRKVRPQLGGGGRAGDGVDSILLIH